MLKRAQALTGASQGVASGLWCMTGWASFPPSFPQHVLTLGQYVQDASCRPVHLLFIPQQFQLPIPNSAQATLMAEARRSPRKSADEAQGNSLHAGTSLKSASLLYFPPQHSATAEMPCVFPSTRMCSPWEQGYFLKNCIFTAQSPGLGQCLAHSTHSINICWGKMNES